MDQPNNFTPRAQQVLQLARKEAERFHHNYLGTEHLLLGLIKLGENGVASGVIQRLGCDLEALRSAVERQMGASVATGAQGVRPLRWWQRWWRKLRRANNAGGETGIPYTPRTKKVLRLAAAESRQLNHSYVGTEHLLLGLLREGEGVAARALKANGLDLWRMREATLKELDPQAMGITNSPATLKSRFFSFPAKLHVFSSDLSGCFTPCAQQVLQLARKEAEGLDHNYLGTEHLLLGLIQLDRCVAAVVLKNLGLDLAAVRDATGRLVGPGVASKTGIPYTPRTKKVLALASQEAARLHHDHVGTGHILLGLMLAGDGVAARVLQSFKVDVDRAREATLKLVAAGGDGAAAPGES